MRVTTLLHGLLSLLLLITAASAAEGSPAPGKNAEIVVVYWSSGDCRWCSYWEGMSGLERKFRESPEFQKLKFYRVKNGYLQDDYFEKELYPADLTWLWERYQAAEFKKPFRPGWWIFVDRKLVVRYGSVKQWEEQAFPRIKELVAQYHGNSAARNQ
jgi:hypothetical protein